jgi:hypothetical protein
MIENKQQIFLEYVNLFSKLNKEQKCNEILEKQKVMLEFLIKYANEKNIQYKLLTKDDVKDYDDLDNIMIYMHNIEELIGILLNI